MTDHTDANDRTDAARTTLSTDRAAGDDDSRRVRSLTTDGQTVVFDADDATRWIQSDTAVDLAEVR